MIQRHSGAEQLTDGLLVTVYQQGGSCEGQRGVVYRAPLRSGPLLVTRASGSPGALAKTDGRLTTVEIDPGRHQTARANFKEAGLAPFIDARLGDAHEIVPALSGPFDFVFSDADKEWYKDYLVAVWPKLVPKGCFMQAGSPPLLSLSRIVVRSFSEVPPALRSPLYGSSGLSGTIVATRVRRCAPVPLSSCSYCSQQVASATSPTRCRRIPRLPRRNQPPRNLPIRRRRLPPSQPRQRRRNRSPNPHHPRRPRLLTNQPRRRRRNQSSHQQRPRRRRSSPQQHRRRRSLLRNPHRQRRHRLPRSQRHPRRGNPSLPRRLHRRQRTRPHRPQARPQPRRSTWMH